MKRINRVEVITAMGPTHLTKLVNEFIADNPMIIVLDIEWKHVNYEYDRQMIFYAYISYHISPTNEYK